MGCLLPVELLAQRQKEQMASPQALSDRYMAKANNNKVMGLIMTGGGISMTLGGLAKMQSPAFEGVSKSDMRLLWLPVAGVLTTLTGALTVKSSKTWRKRANMILMDENVFLVPDRPAFRYMGAGIRVTLP